MAGSHINDKDENAKAWQELRGDNNKGKSRRIDGSSPPFSTPNLSNYEELKKENAELKLKLAKLESKSAYDTLYKTYVDMLEKGGVSSQFSDEVAQNLLEELFELFDVTYKE